MGFVSELSDRNIGRLDHPEDLIGTIVSDFTQSEVLLGAWKQKILTYYELYQMVQKKKHYQGLADIFVPEILRAVETIVQQIFSMIFSQPNWFDYYSRDETEMGSALALTLLTRYQMDENNFKARIMDAIRQMVICGLTVRKIMWDFEEVKRKRKGKDSNGIQSYSSFNDTIKDTWTLEPVDLITFHISDIDVPYNDVQKASWIGEQYIVRKSWCAEKLRKGWFSYAMYDKLNEEESEASASRTTDIVDSRLQTAGYTQIGKKDKYEIIERWGLLPAKYVMTEEERASDKLEEDDLVESIVIIANKKAILKLEVNPFWHNQKPYVVCPYVPKEFELPGIGACQIGEPLQQELNDTRNQVMDNKTLSLSTMWLKSRGSGIKNQDLIIRPNGVITTNDINGLVPLRPPILTGLGINIEGVVKNDLRESVGAPSNIQGIAQSGVDTATESQMINHSAQGRLLMTSELFSQLLLKPMLVFSEYLNYQFYDHMKAIAVIGPKGIRFKSLKPDEIAGGQKYVSIRLSLDSSENPAVKRQQLMNFFTSVVQLPPPVMQLHFKILDKIYGQFFNGHSLDELYPGMAPTAPEDLLTPEEERDIILAGKPVLAKQGQNHMEAIKYLKKEFEDMKYALNKDQAKWFVQLIQSHATLVQQEMQAVQTQMLDKHLAAQAGQEEEAGKSGNMIDQGSTPNTTPFNQDGGAPSTGSLGREIGG